MLDARTGHLFSSLELQGCTTKAIRCLNQRRSQIPESKECISENENEHRLLVATDKGVKLVTFVALNYDAVTKSSQQTGSFVGRVIREYHNPFVDDTLDVEVLANGTQMVSTSIIDRKQGVGNSVVIWDIETVRHQDFNLALIGNHL